ncbi:MAG: radical SAM family heme chaperone HemW [Ginsengibacter sp.]
MAGIYIHIPFCKQACYYCNFHFSTSIGLQEDMMAALVKEIDLSSHSLLKENVEKEIIETIYFGGGTPSLPDPAYIKNLLAAIKNNYIISHDAEITMEANPDDIDKEKLSSWGAVGVNRLSIGIQSFKEKDLVWMNRAHNTIQALESISLVKQAGFDNFSVDLIYGTPGLLDEEWKVNVETVIGMNVPHLACYALTVEPNTALQKMIASKKKTAVDSDHQARQFLLLIQWLKEAGYEHYEISNFAKPGYRSRHNNSYWQGKKYIGIGPSAHSYDGKTRRWNVANNALYIQSIEYNIIPFEEEKLTDTQRLNEYIMTALRTVEGLDLKIIEENFSLWERTRIENEIVKYKNQKKIIINKEKIILTDEGKLFADGIAADLFSITKALH